MALKHLAASLSLVVAIASRAPYGKVQLHIVSDDSTISKQPQNDSTSSIDFMLAQESPKMAAIRTVENVKQHVKKEPYHGRIPMFQIASPGDYSSWDYSSFNTSLPAHHTKFELMWDTILQIKHYFITTRPIHIETLWATKYYWIVALMFTSFGFKFWRRGLKFIHGGKEPEAEPGQMQVRDLRFHAMFIAATLACALAYVLTYFDVLCPIPLPWIYLARFLTFGLVTSALAQVSGAHVLDTLFPAICAASVWVQLGVANIATTPVMHWCLFASSVASASIGISGVASIARTFNRMQFILPPWDIARVTSICYFLVWAATEGIHVLNANIGVLLAVFFDCLFVVGIGHMLLKREKLLENRMRQFGAAQSA